jgi:hypothetical protein
VAGCIGLWLPARRVPTKVATPTLRATRPAKRGAVMKLTKEQSQRLSRERGIWVTNACDKCGKLLGAVRWTQKGEPGEWCSAACRDGITVSAPAPNRAGAGFGEGTERKRPIREKANIGRIGARQAGRPKKHASNAEKQRSYRCRLKSSLALRNTPSECVENTQLADAKNGSHVVHPSRAAERLETAPRIEFVSENSAENLTSGRLVAQ